MRILLAVKWALLPNVSVPATRQFLQVGYSARNLTVYRIRVKEVIELSASYSAGGVREAGTADRRWAACVGMTHDRLNGWQASLPVIGPCTSSQRALSYPSLGLCDLAAVVCAAAPKRICV